MPERIPKSLHFCFGMASDFGGKPWGLSHYVCLRSAVERLSPQDATLYYEFAPEGPWWDLTKGLVDLQRIEAPRVVFDNPLDHPAHRADLVRLDVLIDKGGIYLDTDVFVHRAFDDLLTHSTVLGREGSLLIPQGVANAVILAEPDAPFLTAWREQYRHFRGTRRDYWNEHSVRLPTHLARVFDLPVTLLPPEAFYRPMWRLLDLERIFNSTRRCVTPRTYATHLWDKQSRRYTAGLTPGDVRRHDTNFHRWARPHVEGLPDDLGRSEETIAWPQRLPDFAEIVRDRTYFLKDLGKSAVRPRASYSLPIAAFDRGRG